MATILIERVVRHDITEHFALRWDGAPDPDVLRVPIAAIVELRCTSNPMARYRLLDVGDYHTFDFHVNVINVQRALLGLMLRAQRDLGMSTYPRRSCEYHLSPE